MKAFLQVALAAGLPGSSAKRFPIRSCGIRAPVRQAAVLFCLFLLNAVQAQGPASESPDGVWTALASDELSARKTLGARPWIGPEKFMAVKLDGAILTRILGNAPIEGADTARKASVLLNLPSPAGTFIQFEVWESPVMEPELARWMAEQGWPMKTYQGRSVTDPLSTVRLDWGGPAGFHASVYAPGESYQIDPCWQGDRQSYASYYARDYPRDADFFCEVVEHAGMDVLGDILLTPLNTLRKFRLANAATGEYTAFHGGTPADGLAAIVTTINRVNQIYERDLSVRLVLIGNNQLLVYTNAATDPYSNSDGSAMLSQNQATIDSVIGSANYDIGHVFSTGGGGIAYLGVVGDSSYKAGGVTGNSSPQGDPFDIDYVAHEMGHQFNANHTFDGVLGACAGGNRHDATAYEPGSGATIMAYAGICGSDDLQSNSDAFFHAASLSEILSFVDTLSCYTTSTTGNQNAPTVAAGGDHTIPANTPFELTAANGADSDGDSLTYSWEEFDLSAGSSGILLSAGDHGDNPIFRAWLPTTNANRVFPRLSDLLAGAAAKGEILPTTSRTMNFLVVVRDNHAGGGLTGNDTMTLTATTGAGPFRVTSPNGGETLAGLGAVSWNVANTDLSPVSAAHVNILCSLDGGSNFPYVLAANVANNGSRSVVFPNTSNNTARIKVAAAGNVFFDISDVNFSLRTFVAAPHTLIIVSAHGTPDPDVGVSTQVWGTVLTATVSSPDTQGTTQYVCTGWTGSGSAPANGSTNLAVFMITNDSALTWNWSTQFYLNTTAGANGAVDTADGWHASGAGVTLTATPADGYYFANWTGDVPAADRGANPLSLTMDQARAVTANFSALDAPSGVSASRGTYTDKIRVAWSAAGGATGYQIFRNTSNNSAGAEQIGTATSAPYDDTGVIAGATYYYWLKTANAAGASGFSASDSGYLGVVGPLITANGLVGSVAHQSSETLTIAVQMMNIDPYFGVAVDWWVVALAGSSWYYLNNAIQWTPFDGNLSNCHPVYQGGLFNLPATEVLNMTGLPVGAYTFWFAVDYPPDGVLNLAGPILFDAVNVTVQ